MIIAFIGGGNMASALISGLLQARGDEVTIRVGDPDPEARQRLEHGFGITTHDEAAAAIGGADVIVLAVKPQVMPKVFEGLAGRIEGGQLVVSVAAGVRVESIAGALGKDVPVVRTMPNTPALIGQGVTGLFAGPRCGRRERERAEAIMSAVGATVWVDDEALMDVVTAISGSGPAYFYRLIEALRDAGVSLGLNPDTATTLALQTAHGAGAMAAQSDEDIRELRRKVTSPGGTTQAALEVLEQGGFEALVLLAAEAATRRGRELSGGSDEG